MLRPPPTSTLFPYSTLFRSAYAAAFVMPYIPLIVGIISLMFIYRLAVSLKEPARSEEHLSELQSQSNRVCRLLLEKKKKYHSPRCSSSEHVRFSSLRRALDV